MQYKYENIDVCTSGQVQRANNVMGVQEKASPVAQSALLHVDVVLPRL